MAGKWDSITKLLIGARPWQYMRWLIPNAELIAVLNVELTAQQFFADALLKILIDKQLGLLHIELQTYEDPTMGSRMLKYNVLAEHQYGLPVCSFVIYLRKRKVGKTPYIRRFIDGKITHHFHFRIVKLWEVPAQSILDLGWDGLLPLLTLTKGGKKPEIVQVMIDRLVENGDKDLLVFAEMFGGLAFTDEVGKTRFKRRFAMFQDIMKDSWFYQEIVQEAEEKGMEKGMEQGIEKGREEGRQALYTAIEQTVKQRFPVLETLCQQQVRLVNDLHTLNVLLVSVIAAQEVEVVRTLLMDVTSK